jgi:hypothetical protein
MFLAASKRPPAASPVASTAPVADSTTTDVASAAFSSSLQAASVRERPATIAPVTKRLVISRSLLKQQFLSDAAHMTCRSCDEKGSKHNKSPRSSKQAASSLDCG